ncbi:uncharacterized protein METZ01_LOCUS304848 [marine metagenome]|uniref:Uncharacterized protein n=1 Tax=marine metagenome TaxID=408172 RepID=A0A382MSN8_9ZZZZ
MDIQQLQYCGDLMQSAFMTDPISTFFGFCVWILQVIGDFTGMGYELANIIIFVVVHPALTFALFVLWRRAQRQALECSCTMQVRPTAEQNRKSITSLLMKHGWMSGP